MPLPWKKAKVSRISRFVADLHSPKHGKSSLVVETGFPTSLVDLFVKNRDRLKKPISMKKKKHEKLQQKEEQLFVVEEEEEMVISDPIPLSSSRDLVVEHVYIETTRVENLKGMTESLNSSSNRSEAFVGGNDRSLDDSDKKVVVKGFDHGNQKSVLFAVLKMFVVVVFALSTKRLAVGITLSACLLIFLEFIGKHFIHFLRPCSRATMAFQSSIQRVRLSFHFEERMAFRSLIQWVFWLFQRRLIGEEGSNMEEGDNYNNNNGGSNTMEGDNDDDNVVDSCDLIEVIEANSSVDEIQVVKHRFDMITRLDEREENETIRDLLRLEKRWGILDANGDECASLIFEKQHGHCCKIKRKIIKKLVPKKLRLSRKEKKAAKQIESRDADVMSEVSSCCGDEQLWRYEDTEERDDSDQLVKLKLWRMMEDGGESGEHNRRAGKEDEDGKEGNEKIEHKGSNSSTESLANSGKNSSIELHTKSEKNVVDEVNEDTKRGNSGYLIMFLIVLAGLVGGRAISLLITVASFSVLKLVSRQKLRN